MALRQPLKPNPTIQQLYREAEEAWANQDYQKSIASPYTHAGTLARWPITWVDYRLYDGTSAGPEDLANNFEISRMTIVPEPSSVALLGLAGLLFFRRRQ